MSNSSLDLYSFNFLELETSLPQIYYALCKAPHSSSQKLSVADLHLFVTSKIYVYSSDTWMGKFQLVMQRIWNKIISPPPTASVEDAIDYIFNSLFERSVCQIYCLRRRRIQHIVNTLMQINMHAPTRLNSIVERHQEDVIQEVGENENIQTNAKRFQHTEILEDDELVKIRQIVSDFQRVTYSFWDWALRLHESERQFILEPLCPPLNSSSALLDRSLFEAIAEEQVLTFIQGLTLSDVPYLLLSKLHDPTQLTYTEKKELKKWVQLINQKAHLMTPNCFLTLLTDVMRIIRIEGSLTTSLQDILCGLHQLNCTFIDQLDPNHMTWREQLEPGDHFTCNSQTFCLGLQIEPKEDSLDHFKYFEIQGHPDWLVEIAFNPFQTLIKHSTHFNKNPHGVRLVNYVRLIGQDHAQQAISGLDEAGCCAIINRIDTQHKPWLSEQTRLNKEDEHCVLVLANHCFYMIKNDHLYPLFLENIGFDEANRLTAIKYFPPEKFNFIELEKMCASNAQSNFFVLRFLVHVSQMNQHPVHHYFREEIKHALVTLSNTMPLTKLPYEHDQTHYYESLSSLKNELFDLIEKCLKQISYNLKLFYPEQQASLHQEISRRLVYFYNCYPLATVLRPDLYALVVESFTQQVHYPSPVSQEDERYYQEKFNEMEKYNLLAKELELRDQL